MQEISLSQFCGVVARVPSYVVDSLSNSTIYFSGSNFVIEGKSNIYHYRLNKNRTISLQQVVPKNGSTSKGGEEPKSGPKNQVEIASTASKEKTKESSEPVQEISTEEIKPKKSKWGCPFFHWW